MFVARVADDERPAAIAGVSPRSDVVFGHDGTTLVFSDQQERVVVWDATLHGLYWTASENDPITAPFYNFGRTFPPYRRPGRS